MNIKLTERAVQRDVKKMKILESVELKNCIAGVIYEKRFREGEVIEWLDPVIIFKDDTKQGDYDKVIKLIKEVQLPFVFPEPKNFKTDYYGMSFAGHKSLIKTWGYTSNHLPPNRRWNMDKMKSSASEWLPDTVVIAEIIQKTQNLINEGMEDEEVKEKLMMFLEEKQYC